MYTIKRFDENPFLLPDANEDWEAFAAFNPCVIEQNDEFLIFYRAQSRPHKLHNETLSISSIGFSKGSDTVHFNHRKQLISPSQSWDKFGCEDPRATLLGNKIYIFYTALSFFAFEAKGIRIGLAIANTEGEVLEKHVVTPFNSKAMALFPEKINGKFAAILTANTDLPPAKIALALFDEEQQIWSIDYWEDWYANLDNHVIPLLRNSNDHLEVGAAPVKTAKGWLLIYCYINHYFSDERSFAIEAVLLDLDNPLKVIGRTTEALFTPEEEYELIGDIENVIFPSGALIQGDKLTIYYGATDTTCCAACRSLSELLEKIIFSSSDIFYKSQYLKQGFKRYMNNPIIAPRAEFSWEAKATFNPAAIYSDGKFHLVYRALSNDDTSTFGYASSRDGFTIDERSTSPIYQPSEYFEKKLKPGNSGCEDPRLTIIDQHIYIFYTAFDGYTPRVAYNTILLDDFVNQRWL